MGRRIATDRYVNVTFLVHDNPLADKVKLDINTVEELYAHFICNYTKGNYFLCISYQLLFTHFIIRTTQERIPTYSEWTNFDYTNVLQYDKSTL